MNENNATIEEVFPLLVEAGQNGNKTKFFLPSGKILGCSIYTGNRDNPGTVRASIKSISGEDISKSQHIDNYRNRDAKYMEGFKPLNINGGKDYVFEIVADEPFNANLNADLIFYYERTGNYCQ